MLPGSHCSRAPTTWRGEATNNGFFFGIFVEDRNGNGNVFDGDEIDFSFVIYTKDVGSASAGFPAMCTPGGSEGRLHLSAGNGGNGALPSGEVPFGEAWVRVCPPEAPRLHTQRELTR